MELYYLLYGMWEQRRDRVALFLSRIVVHCDRVGLSFIKRRSRDIFVIAVTFRYLHERTLSTQNHETNIRRINQQLAESLNIIKQ